MSTDTLDSVISLAGAINDTMYGFTNRWFHALMHSSLSSIVDNAVVNEFIELQTLDDESSVKNQVIEFIERCEWNRVH